jgi:hypothetical protein
MENNTNTSDLKSFRQMGVNNSYWGREHSEESKEAISNSMKQFHASKREAEAT